MNSSAHKKYIFAYAKQIFLIYLENTFNMFCIMSAWRILLIPNIIAISSKFMKLNEIKTSNIIGVIVCVTFLLFFAIITSRSIVSNLLNGMNIISNGATTMTGFLSEIQKGGIVIVNNRSGSKHLSPRLIKIFKAGVNLKHIDTCDSICIAYFNYKFTSQSDHAVKTAIGIWDAKELPPFKTTFPCPSKYKLLFKFIYTCAVVIVALILTSLLKFIIVLALSVQVSNMNI